MARSYFEGSIFLFFSIPILLVIVLNVVGVSLDVLLTIVIFVYALGDSVLGWVVPFLRSRVDDRYVSHNVTDVYYLNFFIGAFLNEVALLPVF